MESRQPQRAWRIFWPLLILLVAAALRLIGIDAVPPGMTHDEADHGLAAWGVVNGDRPIYFTVGYGREPLFDYSTAALMSFLGPTFLAGRLTAVFFGLLLIAGAYAWTRVAFGRRVALLNAAGLAVSFWPLMTARQALRSVTLPAIFVLAAYFFWRRARGKGQGAVGTVGEGAVRYAAPERPQRGQPLLPTPYSLLPAATLLGLTFYTYIPARVLWLVFPALLLHAAFYNRSLLARIWQGTLVMLLLAGLIAAPLFLYLLTYEGVETRLYQLNQPLVAAAQGNFQPLAENASAALGLFTFQGDPTWRYNIPGRPLLTPVMGLLFYAGLLLAAWHAFKPIPNRQLAKLPATDNQSPRHPVTPSPCHLVTPSAHFFALTWLAAGLSPALITGPELSTTQAIGMQPVLFLFPALALVAAGDQVTLWLSRSSRARERALASRLSPYLAVLFFAGILVVTVRDYFVHWGQAPEVRVQYETTLVAAVEHLDQVGNGPAAISTTTPDRFHSPATALMYQDDETVSLRWFNGRHSLLLPQDGSSWLLFSGFAPLGEHLGIYFAPDATPESLPLRPTDLDRPITLYHVDGAALLAALRPQFSQLGAHPALPATFSATASLLGYHFQTPEVRPGEVVRLATLWRVEQPSAQELVIFSHVLDGEGEIVAQADRLDVPSPTWHPGDVFIQLHQITLPPDLPAGRYPLAVGLYRREDEGRLPLDEPGSANLISLPPLIVAP